MTPPITATITNKQCQAALKLLRPYLLSRPKHSPVVPSRDDPANSRLVLLADRIAKWIAPLTLAAAAGSAFIWFLIDPSRSLPVAVARMTASHTA